MDQSRGLLSVPSAGGGTGVVILTGTAKKKVAEQKNKGMYCKFNKTKNCIEKNIVWRITNM